MVVKALTKTGKWILYLLAALIILIALLVASVRLAVLYSDDNSEELASLVSSFVGSPVEIGDVDVVWNRFDASASLKDVQIRSADGAETLLELPQVELQLNVRDVLLERRLSVRNIQLSNLSLAASYEGRGQLRMFGRRLGRDAAGPDENPNQPELAQDSQQNPQQIGATGSGSALDWLFNAERISILDSEITLIDAMKDREYKIENVNIRAFNDDDLHQIRISSALPGEIGDSSLASFDFTGDADNISDWKGEFYVNTGGLDIAELSDLWRTPQQDFAGTAELQLWGSWSGAKVTKLRAIASATDLYVQQPSASGTFNASLQADQVNLDLDWFRLDSGWQLTFNQLTGRLDNQDLEFSGLELQASHDAEEEYFSVAGPDIDLQALKPLKSYVDAMLPDDVPFRTHALRRGLLTDWRASGIVADNNKPTLTELRVNAVDLAIDPYDKIPGISNLTAAIAYDGEVGRIVIGNQDVSLSMPELYDNPLPSVNIEGVVDFLVATDTPNAVTKVVANAASNVTGSAAVTETATIDSSASSTLKWKAVTEDLRISSLDFDTSSIVSISGHSDGSQMIDLHTSILNANVARLQEYYPVRKIKPTLLNWLQTAIVGGDAVRGRVEVKGNLADFAPADGRGHFYAEADLVDATVKFEPDWPAATGMDGNVSFSTTSMRGRVYQGSIRQANFNDVRLLISDFSHPVIGVQASAIGPVADLLDFVQTGPLAPSIGGVFGESTGSGTTRFVLDLKVPLNDSLPDEIYVDGEVRLDNAQINSRAFGLDLDSVTGNVGFNRRGVTFDNVAVRYQGLPLDVSAVQTRGSDGDHNRIRVKGPMAAASVMHSYGIPLAEQFEGTSQWTIDVDVHRAESSNESRIELTAISDLAGTEFDLPAPFNKASDERLNIRVYFDFSGQENDWWLEVPGLVKGRVRVNDDFEFESMAVALGESQNYVLPWRGIAVHGDTHRLDADGWLRLALGFETEEDAEAVPLFAKVSTGEMAIGDQVFDDLVYIAYRDGVNQVHRVENALMSGEFTRRRSNDPGDPLVVRLDRLDKRLLVALADSEEALRASGKVTGQLIDPRDIPPIDMRVSELIWDNWRFTNGALRTEPSDDGMQITALTARQNSMRVSGRGSWKQSNDSGVTSDLTALDLTASFEDFGRAMSDIANVNSFAEGTGEAALSLNWPTPAYAPDLNQLQGQLLFNLRDGRILSVQPGAGRILGLFALQALPRRLTFNFRDLTANGLEYSGVSGNMFIANGQAQTNAIAMSGPVAEILIRGSTGFVDNTYDQTIDVLPRVSGALPLLGILSGGPAAGITALLADGILKTLGINLDAMSKVRYSVTGSWSDPVWETVDLAPGNIVER